VDIKAETRRPTSSKKSTVHCRHCKDSQLPVTDPKSKHLSFQRIKHGGDNHGNSHIGQKNTRITNVSK
jgi:hypothetical protein